VWVGLVVAVAALAATIRVGSGNPVSRAVLTLDSADRDLSQSHRTPLGDDIARLLRKWGEPAAFLPVVGGFLLVGWLRTDRRQVRRAARIAGTLALAGLVCWALKLPIGRVRPRWSEDPAVFRPFSRAESFPSGHTTTAFALSASLAEGLVSPVGTVVLYSLAVGTGWSRVNDNKHWTSDVVAGALVGILSAFWVRRRWPQASDPSLQTDATPGSSNSDPASQAHPSRPFPTPAVPSLPPESG
jgi:membrane-associated phospholipid phosphatase